MDFDLVNDFCLYICYRENLQARFFYMWVSQFEISRDNRMNERMVTL